MDTVTRCAACGADLDPDGPSLEFCDAVCQRAWAAEQHTDGYRAETRPDAAPVLPERDARGIDLEDGPRRRADQPDGRFEDNATVWADALAAALPERFTVELHRGDRGTARFVVPCPGPDCSVVHTADLEPWTLADHDAAGRALYVLNITIRDHDLDQHQPARPARSAVSEALRRLFSVSVTRDAPRNLWTVVAQCRTCGQAQTQRITDYETVARSVDALEAVLLDRLTRRDPCHQPGSGRSTQAPGPARDATRGNPPAGDGEAPGRVAGIHGRVTRDGDVLTFAAGSIHVRPADEPWRHGEPVDEPWRPMGWTDGVDLGGVVETSGAGYSRLEVTTWPSITVNASTEAAQAVLDIMRGRPADLVVVDESTRTPEDAWLDELHHSTRSSGVVQYLERDPLVDERVRTAAPQWSPPDGATIYEDLLALQDRVSARTGAGMDVRNHTEDARQAIGAEDLGVIAQRQAERIGLGLEQHDARRLVRVDGP